MTNEQIAEQLVNRLDDINTMDSDQRAASLLVITAALKEKDMERGKAIVRAEMIAAFAEGLCIAVDGHTVLPATNEYLSAQVRYTRANIAQYMPPAAESARGGEKGAGE